MEMFVGYLSTSFFQEHMLLFFLIIERFHSRDLQEFNPSNQSVLRIQRHVKHSITIFIWSIYKHD